MEPAPADVAGSSSWAVGTALATALAARGERRFGEDLLFLAAVADIGSSAALRLADGGVWGSVGAEEATVSADRGIALEDLAEFAEAGGAPSAEKLWWYCNACGGGPWT